MATKEYKLLEISWLKGFCDDLLADRDPASIKKRLKFLLDFYGIINFPLVPSPDKLIFRARKTDEHGFNHVSELGCPPAELTGAGRLNEPHRPILYTSQNMWSAYDEIRAKKDDYVQVVSYKFRESQAPNTAIIGDIKDIFRWGQSKHSSAITDHVKTTFNSLAERNPLALKSYIYTDSFLSDLITDHAASEKKYIHTCSIGELIFEKHTNLDAICYQGIESSGALNLAFKESRVLDILSIDSIHLFKIDHSYGYGVYDQTLVKAAKSIEGSGRIFWE